MTLRTRLALSHFFVIGLFICIFASIVVFIKGGLGPPRSSRQAQELICQITESTTSRTDLENKLDGLDLPREIEISLRNAHGRVEKSWGARQARDSEDLGHTQSFVETLPFRQGALVGSLLEFRAFRPHPRDGSFWNPIRDLLVAASLAGLGCIAISVLISNFISKPVAKLAEAVEKFEGQPLAQRLETSGPPEIKELAATFNEMTERLSSNMEELRHQKEEAERSEASRREFLGEVSHNLRTPLAAILGWTDSLLDDLAQGEETAYLKRIRRETRYVARTIERLLDLSRWERAQPMLYAESFALAEILLETAENLEEAAMEKEVVLNLNFPEEPCWVRADRHRVRDLFQILLENVVEHAGTGVRVEVSVQRRDARYWVTVADDGVGLPDSLKHGWNGDPLVSETGRASLGLAIAQRLAKAHDGELELRSGENGIGAVAAFSLLATDLERRS